MVKITHCNALLIYLPGFKKKKEKDAKLPSFRDELTAAKLELD